MKRMNKKTRRCIRFTGIAIIVALIGVLLGFRMLNTSDSSVNHREIGE